MKYIFISIFIFYFHLFFNCGGNIPDSSNIDLSGNDWSISLSDNPNYALPETLHTEWDTVSLPGNLKNYFKDSDGSIWLRKNFDFNQEFLIGNPALYLGKVFENDQVYINGNLIGDSGGKPINFGMKRIYPIQPGYLQEGENLIAIRISSNLNGSVGILTSPVAIYPTNIAYSKYWQESTKEFIYISFFFFIGLFYFLNYLRMQDNKDYLSFSLFAFAYCLYEFTRNDIRFIIWDHFLFFKFIEYSILMFIPYLFIRFIEDFLHYPRNKFSKVHFMISCGFVLVLAIFHNHVFWYSFVGYWDLHLPIALGYTVYITFKKINDKKIEAYVNLIGLTYIFYAVIKQISIERGWIHADSNMETSIIFYFFLMTLALRLKFLFIKRGILKRYDQLKEADALREKVFNHMDLMISDSLKNMHSMIQGLLSGLKLVSNDKNNTNSPSIKESLEIINKIESIQANLQPLMDDIIELSRLEVMNELPFKTSITFIDFIKEVIPKDSITYTIRVSPDTMIENSLELINSIVIRLIDFPAIKEFTHNDLIITQDLIGNIHFRFLLYHRNPKVAIRLYNELSSKSIPEDTNTVKWQIIQQIARLLNAKLEFKIIKRKYLRIDLGLKSIKENSPISRIQPIEIGRNKKLTYFNWKLLFDQVKEKLKNFSKK